MLVFGVELCMSKYHIEVKPRMAQTSVLIQASVVPFVIRSKSRVNIYESLIAEP